MHPEPREWVLGAEGMVGHFLSFDREEDARWWLNYINDHLDALAAAQADAEELTEENADLRKELDERILHNTRLFMEVNRWRDAFYAVEDAVHNVSSVYEVAKHHAESDAALTPTEEESNG